jgi:hypothetical protein
MQFPRRTEADLPDDRADESAASAEYCRQARRLRHELRDNPLRLHASLARLAKPLAEVEQDDQRPARPCMRLARPETGGLTLECNPLAAEAFAGQVAESCCGGIVRYSQRTSLMRQARKLGIGRFEANLIIATVVHRQACEEEREELRRQRRLPAVIALIFFVEALVALAAWRIFG